MAFGQLVNAQQVEVVVAGPGDVTRLYLCQGIARGASNVTAPPGQTQTVTDTWQFHIGPSLDAGQFRRAIATLSFAGLQEQDPSGSGWVNYDLQSFGADFDDDKGKVKVNVTNSLQMTNFGSTDYGASAITQLSYNVAILAAL